MEVTKTTPNTNFIKQLESNSSKRDRRKGNKGIHALTLKTLRENDVLRHINLSLEKKIKVFRFSTYLLSFLIIMIFQISFASKLVG